MDGGGRGLAHSFALLPIAGRVTGELDDARAPTFPRDPLIESRDDLIGIFAGGEKPREAWRIGTEHEKFVYRRRDHRAPSYDEPGGIRDLLKG